MMVPFDIPAAGALRRIRVGLGLSQSEFGTVLGFGPKAERVVRRWEADDAFRPTPLAWAAVRYLVMLMDIYGRLPPGPRKEEISGLLPECLK